MKGAHIMVKHYFELDILNHAIRTPLAGILGMLDILHSGPLTAQQRDCLQDIDIASTELLHAVEGFLKQGQALISQTNGPGLYDND
jgi:signal transduction histidine kinase